jgi:branched-chain amino acid transport system substrate-binding protein
MSRLTLAALAASTMLTVTTAAHAQIVIATAGPMTGQYASFGEQMRTGAEQAVADINAAGGVLGQQLELIVGDDACDPKQAVAVANQFAGDGVSFVAGHFCSGSSIPSSSVYADEGIIQISPASTNPKFTDERPNPAGGTYRVCGRDDQQGQVAGAYLATNFDGQNVAFLHDKTAYGKGLADATLAAYQASGASETLYEAYTAGEKDYSALVTKLKGENVDVVYVGGYHTEAGLIVRQMRDQGMTTQLVSGDALVTDEYWAITGDAGEGTLMTFSPNPENMDTAVAVVQSLRDAGKPTEGYVLYTYAAIQTWAQAAEAAGATDYDSLLDALNAGSFETVIGALSFDDKGDVSLPGYVFYEWSNGSYTEIN